MRFHNEVDEMAWLEEELDIELGRYDGYHQQTSAVQQDARHRPMPPRRGSYDPDAEMRWLEEAMQCEMGRGIAGRHVAPRRLPRRTGPIRIPEHPQPWVGGRSKPTVNSRDAWREVTLHSNAD